MESNIFLSGCNFTFFNVKTVPIKELVYIYAYAFLRGSVLNLQDVVLHVKCL
jgi:hypothetical protein